MIATRRQLDEAILAAVTGGTGPLDPLLYRGEENPVVGPVPPGTGPMLTPIGEGSGSATNGASPLP